MVNFTVTDVTGGSSLRLDIPTDVSVSEIACIAREIRGSDGFILRKGYSLLRNDRPIGDSISDGDVVDVIPDPMLVPKV